MTDPARWRWLALLTVLLLSLGRPARAEDLSVTFDDLPVFGRRGKIEEAEAMTRRLLDGLVRHRVPATGFVNEIQLEGPERDQRTALLSRWLDAGMNLGNHRYLRLLLTTTPVEAYIADVARGEAVTRPLMTAHGKTERFYRHPYLETGATTKARARFEGWLAVHATASRR